MLRPAMTQILKPGESYYKFVVAVAKKAREIAAEAEENHIALEEKPVSLALDLFATGAERLSDFDCSIPLQSRFAGAALFCLPARIFLGQSAARAPAPATPFTPNFISPQRLPCVRGNEVAAR